MPKVAVICYRSLIHGFAPCVLRETMQPFSASLITLRSESGGIPINYSRSSGLLGTADESVYVLFWPQSLFTRGGVREFFPLDDPFCPAWSFRTLSVRVYAWRYMHGLHFRSLLWIPAVGFWKYCEMNGLAVIHSTLSTKQKKEFSILC
jgi:hypothetical protein